MNEVRWDENSYSALMQALTEQGESIVKLCMKHMERNSTATWANMFGWGISARSSALNVGLRTMIEQRNVMCALPIIRMQLDNVLRLYAGFFSDDPQSFCRSVRKGERINKMKSSDGHRMTDAWLVERLSTKSPWMKDVYETTSGYIHLSGKHMEHVIKRNADGTAQVFIGPDERYRTDNECTEPMRCMRHLNAILEFALDDWFTRMCNPDGSVSPHPGHGK